MTRFAAECLEYLKRSALDGFPDLVYYDLYKDHAGQPLFLINPKGHHAISLNDGKPIK